jgi:hypothetical protein
MAKKLSKTGIQLNQPVLPFQVSQSVDAFTGADDYDISISGSLTVTGSITGEPGVENNLTASYATNALTASYAFSASVEIRKEISSSYADNAGGLIFNPNINVNRSFKYKCKSICICF